MKLKGGCRPPIDRMEPGARTPSVLGGLLFVLVAASFSGCGNVVRFTASASSSDVTETDSTGRGWTTPQLADLGGISSLYVAQALLFQESTYRDFELRANTSQAVLALAARSGASTRAVVRRYQPRELGGSGWEPFGGASTTFGTSFNPTDVLVGVGSDGEAIVSFWDGAAQLSAYLPADGDWRDLRTNAADFGPFGGLTVYGSDSAVPITLPALPGFWPASPKDQAGLDASVMGTQDWNDRLFPYGRSTSSAWDSFGNAYVSRLYTDGTEHFLVTQKYVPDAGWSVLRSGSSLQSVMSLGVGTSTNHPQVQLLDDGFGVTVLARTELTYSEPGLSLEADSRLISQWIVGNSIVQGEPNTAGEAIDFSGLGVNDPQVFSAATDKQGNVLVVFYDEMPSVECSSDTEPVGTNCQYRLFAAVRGATGAWAGPSRIDVNLSPATTTFYQGEYWGGVSDGAIQGGMPFAKPGVVALGPGQFMVVYAGTDLLARTGFVRALKYSVQSGWDLNNEEVLLTRCLTGSQSNCALGSLSSSYRMVNEITAADNGTGDAIFVLQEVAEADDLTTPSLRRMGFRAFRYTKTDWAKDPSDSSSLKLTWLNELGGLSIPYCRMSAGVHGYDLPNCNRGGAQAAIFSSGEAVIVFPAPVAERTAVTSGAWLGAGAGDFENTELYTVEYR